MVTNTVTFHAPLDRRNGTLAIATQERKIVFFQIYLRTECLMQTIFCWYVVIIKIPHHNEIFTLINVTFANYAVLVHFFKKK